VMAETVTRARIINEQQQIKIVPPTLIRAYYFEVQRRNKDWIPVSVVDGKWCCGVVTARKRDDRLVGCAYRQCMDKPFCSHTLAVEFWLKNREVPVEWWR